jgi:lysophospholipase L1-like esterase
VTAPDAPDAPLPGPRLPWPAQRRPLSVLAFGNSVATLQLPGRADRADGTYVEVLADLLAGYGVPVVPHVESRWFDFLHRAMRDYETRVRVHAPDVVIVQFGLNEYQPWLAPVWLVRHLMVANQASTRTARAYRARVAPRLWAALRTYRQRAAPLVGMRTWQVTPERFAGHLRRLLRNVHVEARPLVLVLDIDAPGARLEHFLPGMTARHAVYQDVIARVVREYDDPDVRLVRVSELTAGLGPTALPDEMHYTAATHRAVGELLATEVVSWLESRGQARSTSP